MGLRSSSRAFKPARLVETTTGGSANLRSAFLYVGTAISPSRLSAFTPTSTIPQEDRPAQFKVPYGLGVMAVNTRVYSYAVLLLFQLVALSNTGCHSYAKEMAYLIQINVPPVLSSNFLSAIQARRVGALSTYSLNSTRNEELQPKPELWISIS